MERSYPKITVKLFADQVPAQIEEILDSSISGNKKQEVAMLGVIVALCVALLQATMSIPKRPRSISLSLVPLSAAWRCRLLRPA